MALKKRPAVEVIKIAKERKREPENITKLYLIDYTKLNAAGIEGLSSMDKAVYNAIAAIYDNRKDFCAEGEVFITPCEIYRVMNGIQINDYAFSISEGQYGMLVDTVKKLSRTTVAVGGGSLSLLDATSSTALSKKGLKLDGFLVRSEPALFSYCRDNDLLLSVFFNFIDTRTELRNEKDVPAYKCYLLEKILNMKKKKKESIRIMLDELYEETHLLTPEEDTDKRGRVYKNRESRLTTIRKKSAVDRKKIEHLLFFWQDRKLISSFAVISDLSGAYIGYEVRA